MRRDNAKIRVMLVFGTRPEAIKLAPVIIKLKEKSDIFSPFVVVTGQHRQMLDQVLDLFGIEPDLDMSIMTEGQQLNDISSKILIKMEDILQHERPDIILVQGDTTSAFASSLAAFHHHIRIGHVEAGLRTWNKYNPFPEEINRQLISVVADLHFAPTATARKNLLQHKIPEDKIFITGNTTIDALFMTVRNDYTFDNPLLNEISSNGRKVVMVTTHRRESFGEPMLNALKAIRQVVEKYENVEVVFPVHYNPNVRKAVSEIINNNERIHLIDPLDYKNFAHLMARSYLFITDSGGVQEESPSLGIPVLVLRDTTERPEGIKAGTAKLVGTDTNNILNVFCELMDDESVYSRMARAANPYGDGKASDRIVKILSEYCKKEN